MMFIQQIFINSIEILIPEFFLSISLLFLLLFSTIFSQNTKKKNYVFFKILNKLTIFVFILTIYLYLNIFENYTNILFNIFYFNNNLKFIKIFILIITICCLLSLPTTLKKITNIFKFEILILFIFSILGLFLFLSSYNFIILYLSLELFSLSFYTLTAINRNSILSVESGLKYFIYGAFSSGIILYGISLLYGLTGIINFKDFYYFFYTWYDSNYNFSILFALLLIFSGFFFKVGVVPYHTWLPDVYEGALINITMFFSLIPKLVIFYVISLFYFIIFSNCFNEKISFFIQFLILFSLIIGIFGTLFQKKIKRLLAYSTISHTGFILFIFLTKNLNNLEYLFIYISIYIFINILLWLSIIYFKESINFKYITDFLSLYKINYLLLFYIAIILFSISGIPPLLGFFSKFLIFFLAAKESFFFILIIGILLSSISVFYYLRFVKIIFFEHKYNFNFFNILKIEYAFLISLSFFLNCFFFFYGKLFLNFIQYLNITFLLI